MIRPRIRDNQCTNSGTPITSQTKHQKIELITLLDKCTQICKDDRLILRTLIKEENLEVLQLLIKHKRNADMLILQSNLRKIVNKYKNRKSEAKQYITLQPSSSFIKLPTNNTSFETTGVSNGRGKRSISPMVKKYYSNNSSNILTNQTCNTMQTRDPLSQLNNSNTTINRSVSSNQIFGNRSLSNNNINKKRIASKDRNSNQDENQNNSYLFNTSSFIQNTNNYSNIVNELSMNSVENRKQMVQQNSQSQQQQQLQQLQNNSNNLYQQPHHSHQFSNASIGGQINMNNFQGNNTINTIQHDNSQNISYTNLNTTNLNFYQDIAEGNYQFNFSNRTSLNGGSMINNMNNIQGQLNQLYQQQQQGSFQQQKEKEQQEQVLTQQNMLYLQQQILHHNQQNNNQQNNDSFPYFPTNSNTNINNKNVSNNNSHSQLDMHALTLGQNQLMFYNQNQSNQDNQFNNNIQPQSSKSTQSNQQFGFENSSNNIKYNNNQNGQVIVKESSPTGQNFQSRKSPEFQNDQEEDRILSVQENVKRSVSSGWQNPQQSVDITRQSKNSQRYQNMGSISDQQSIQNLGQNQKGEQEQFFNFSNNRQSNQSNNLETSLTTNNNINDYTENERVQDQFDDNLKEDRPLKVNAILSTYQAQQKLQSQASTQQQMDTMLRSSRNNYSDSKRDQSMPEYSPFRQTYYNTKNQQTQRSQNQNQPDNEEDELVEAESVFQNSEQKFFLSARKILSQKKLIEQTMRKSQNKYEDNRNTNEINKSNLSQIQPNNTERKCSEFNYDEQSDVKNINFNTDNYFRESRNNRLSEFDEDAVKKSKLQREISCNISNSKKVETFNPPTVSSCINLEDRLMSSNKKQNFNLFGVNNNTNNFSGISNLNNLNQTNLNLQFQNTEDNKEIHLNDYGMNYNRGDHCNLSNYSNSICGGASSFANNLNNTQKNTFIVNNVTNNNLWSQFDNSASKSNSGISVGQSLERRGGFNGYDEVSIEKKVVQPQVAYKHDDVFTPADFIKRMTEGINLNKKDIASTIVIPPPPPTINIIPSVLPNTTTSTITTTTTTIITNTCISSNNNNNNIGNPSSNQNIISQRSSSSCITSPTAATTTLYAIPPFKTPLVQTSTNNPLYLENVGRSNSVSTSYIGCLPAISSTPSTTTAAATLSSQAIRGASLKKEHSSLLTNWDELLKPTGIKKTQSFIEIINPISPSIRTDNGLQNTNRTDILQGGSNILNKNNTANNLVSNYFNPLNTDFTSRSNINNYTTNAMTNNINVVSQYHQQTDQNNHLFQQMKNSAFLTSQSQSISQRKGNENISQTTNIINADSSRFDVMRDDLNKSSLNNNNKGLQQDYSNQIHQNSMHKYQDQSPQSSINNGNSTNYFTKASKDTYSQKDTIHNRYTQETPVADITSDNLVEDNNSGLVKGYQNNSINRSSRLNTSIDNSKWIRQNYHFQDTSPSALASKSQRIKNIRESCEQLYENGIQMQNTLQNLKNSAINQLQKSLDASTLALLKQGSNSEQKSSLILRGNSVNNPNRESQSFTMLKQYQNEQQQQHKTPNKTNRTLSECSSSRSPNKENEKEFLIQTNAKTEYEISDSKPFKFSHSNYGNHLRRISNNTTQGQFEQDMNNTSDNNNLYIPHNNNILQSNINILNYNSASIPVQEGAESALNPLEIQSTTKRGQDSAFTNKGSQMKSMFNKNQMYSVEEAVQDNNSQNQFNNESDCYQNSGQSYPYYENQEEYLDQNNYYLNEMPSSDVFYNYKNQIDEIREEQEKESGMNNNQDSQQDEKDDIDLYDIHQQQQLYFKQSEPVPSNQIYQPQQDEVEDAVQDESNAIYESGQMTLAQQLTSKQIFTEVQKTFFIERLKLNQFTCEEMFDEIFADSNLNKISRAFFRFKIEQLLSTCDGNHSSRDECNSNTSVDSDNVDSFFDLINFKKDGFLDVNELGFSLEQICESESQNQVRTALEYLKERLGIQRNYITLQDIEGIFNNQEEYKEFVECVDSSQKGFFTYWDLYLKQITYFWNFFDQCF